MGLFRYWTLLQIPNFILAAPLLALSFFASYHYYTCDLHTVVTSTLPFLPPSFRPAKSRSTSQSNRAFFSPTLLPFIHLHTALTLILLVASHVQIILRVSATNPVIFWYASDLISSVDPSAPGAPGEHIKNRKDEEDVESNRERMLVRQRWGKRWIKYCLIWGGISLILWAGYYPPA